MADPSTIAIRLHQRALIEQNAGRPARALTLLDRALSALDDLERDRNIDSLVAGIWISIGYNRAECQTADAGLSAVTVGLDRAIASGDLRLIGEAHAQRAGIAQRAGRLDLALEGFSEVVPFEHNLGALSRFSFLLNFANLRMVRHELAPARRMLEAAARIANEHGMAAQELKALHNLGYAEFLGGDLPRALRSMDEAFTIDADVARGVCLLDRARVLAEAGLLNDADRCLATAGELLRRDRSYLDLADSELERARCALLSEDHQAARRLAGRARDRFRRQGNEQWRRTAELVLLQADLAAGRPGRRLVVPASRLRDELLVDGLRGPARTAALIVVEANLSAGRNDEAVSALTQVGRDLMSDPITARLHAVYVRARVEEVQGRRARAAGRVAQGLAELALYQSHFGSVDLSTAAAIHGRRLADLDVELAVASGRSETILAAAERGRSVTSRLPAVRPPEDEVTASLLSELRQVVETLRTVELNPRTSGPIAQRRSELEAQIARRAWTRPGERAVGEVADLGDVQRALATQDTTLVLFVVAGAHLVGVVVESGHVHHQVLGPIATVLEQVRRVRADLDVLAQPVLPPPIKTAVRASFARSVAALDEVLIRPLNVSGRLVVVTTGLLGAIPWNELPSLRGVPLTVAPSATAWVAAAGRGRRSGGRRIVSVAGPGLVRSTDEAADVALAWGAAKVISGAAATGSNLSKSMATARVLHIAAHGTHQSENPLFSSLRLADGPLFAHELDQTAGTPEHVVLSACELGLATVRPGDEALGLTSVLLRLGTKSVVAGVARIGDDLAAETMGAYHRLLAAGQDSASALAAATAASDHPVPLVNFGATWCK